jgi:tetratricopeptide (TPR) repeat protein
MRVNDGFHRAVFRRADCGRFHRHSGPDLDVAHLSRYLRSTRSVMRHVDAHRGRAYYDKKDNDRAIADYSKAIELNQQNANAYFDRGNAYLGKNDHDRAIVDYSKAIELNPQYAEAYYNRAVAYNVKGDKERSDADAGKAAQLAPDMPGSLPSKRALRRGSAKDLSVRRTASHSRF